MKIYKVTYKSNYFEEKFIQREQKLENKREEEYETS